MTQEERERLKKQLLFVQPETKEDLSVWIRTYLGNEYDLPDAIIDPDSNSSPMDLVWEIYSRGKACDPDMNRILAYAAREAFKTLGASILEVLFVVLLERNVAHMAAIEPQAKKAQSYVKKFFKKSPLRDFISKSNERSIHFTRYKHPNGMVLNPKEWAALSEPERDQYEEKINYIEIVIATVSGANSSHVPFFCVEANTKILIKHETDKADNGTDRPTKRNRASRSARGIFRRLAGLKPGGRSGGETEQDITSPKELVEVLAVNPETGDLAFKPIIRAQQHKRETIRLSCLGGEELVCTPDHPVYVIGKGFVQAGDLKVGDYLVTVGSTVVESAGSSLKKTYDDLYVESKPEVVDDEWHQVVLGSLLGDCGIYKKPSNNPFILENHCVEQADYLAWKREIVSRKIRTIDTHSKSGYTGADQVGFRSGCSPLLLPYVNVRKTLDGVDRIGPLGLAVWYMDDGCAGNGFTLSTEGFTEQQNHRLADLLMDRFGIKVTVCPYAKGDKVYHRLSGGVEAKRRLVDVCGKHVHPSMAYKFDLTANVGICEFCGAKFWFYERGRSAKTCTSAICLRLRTNNKNSSSLSRAKVVSIEPAGDAWVYDFTVADFHTLVTNRILSKNCMDELDVADPIPVEEAKMIPTQGDNGEPSITFFTSSRKGSHGPVQAEIDKASTTGMHIRHWNIIDVTKRCPPERHRPDLPKLPIYTSDEHLNAVNEENFKLISEKERESYRQVEGFAGCLTNCKLFSVCKGRLASQPSTSKLLKNITEVQHKIRGVDTEYAKAQLMCWKPSREGNIYPRLDPEKHKKTAAQIAEMVTGERYPETFTKQQLVQLFKTRDAAFFSGIDHGFSHFFACVTGVRDGNRMFVLDAIGEAELEVSDKVNRMTERFGALGISPVIFADPEDPGSNKTLSKHFSLRKWDKGPGSVLEGIQVVRQKLTPSLGGAPELFFLKDDPQVDALFLQLERYHWKLDAAGEPTKDPVKKDDDLADALRYLVMNVFSKTGKMVVSVQTGPDQQNVGPGGTKQYSQQDWIKEKVNELTGGNGGQGDGNTTNVSKTGKFFIGVAAPESEYSVSYTEPIDGSDKTVFWMRDPEEH